MPLLNPIFVLLDTMMCVSRALPKNLVPGSLLSLGPLGAKGYARTGVITSQLGSPRGRESDFTEIQDASTTSHAT
jgi:hypothetical protein